MPDDQKRPFADEVAEQAGMAVSDFRARSSRGHAPRPVEYVRHAGATRAVYDPAEVEQYLIARRARLASRAGSPRKDV